MLGYIEFDDGAEKARLAPRQIMGGTFLVLNLGRNGRGPLAGHHAARAARRMWEQGVRTAVFPLDFPCTAAFLRQGIRPADPLPLRRRLCASLAHRRLGELGITPAQGVIAVSASHLTGEIMETTKALAQNYRYVMLSVPAGGEEFARSLRRTCGVSLILRPSTDQLDHADALILFSPRGDLQRENKVLYTLYPGGEIGRGGMPLSLRTEPSDGVAPNCSHEQLAAALHSMGILRPEMLIM